MKNGSCTFNKQLKKYIDVRQAYSRCFCVVHRAWPWRDVQQMEREYGALGSAEVIVLCMFFEKHNKSRNVGLG